MCMASLLSVGCVRKGIRSKTLSNLLCGISAVVTLDRVAERRRRMCVAAYNILNDTVVTILYHRYIIKVNREES